MQLRPDVAIPAMIKSLTDVVLPAVDSDNALAVEQLQVTIGLLGLMAARLPLEFAYDRDELERLLGLSRDLLEAGGAEAAESAALQDALALGADVHARAAADPREVLDAVRALRATSGALIGTLTAAADESLRQRVKELVTSHAGEQLLRERAWVAPQGWEARPEAVPPIEELLDRSR